ncbi:MULTISPECIES: hypothetical protein [unclassified Acinetobacter]|uniref:hypothetical protein n=1 Tax=unclassified Acinetobacter TaxID=196816 RepID=UPI0035BB6CF5
MALPAGEASNEAVDPALYHASNENNTTADNDNSSQFDKLSDTATGDYVINLFFDDDLVNRTEIVGDPEL